MRRVIFNLGLFTQSKWDWILVIFGLGGVLIYVWHQFFLVHSIVGPAYGGIMTESTVGTVRNMNPFSRNSSLLDKQLQKLIFSGLLRYDPISGQIESGLADLRISEDGKTYFLTIKDSATFHDGRRVTTNDVIFTYEKLIQNPSFPNKVLKDTFEYVTIDVVDQKTLAFHIPEKNVYFSSSLMVPILPEKYFPNVLIEEVVDPDYPFNKKPIGTGPFQFQRIVPNDDGSFRIFLSANQYYYAGTPKIEQIVFYVFPDYKHLELSKEWTTFFSKIPFWENENFEKDLFDDYERREYLLPRFTGVFFNLDKLAVSNLYLRQALARAFDLGDLLEKEKGWEKVFSPFFFEGIQDWEEKNFIEAREILRDHGFPYDEELGLRTIGKGGDPISFTLITSTDPPVYSRFAQKIIQTWKKELGIQVQLNILSPEELKEALEKRDYDGILFGQDFSENFDSLSLWHSSQSGKLNLSNITREDLDFLIDEIRFYGTQEDLVELNNLLAEIVPAIIFTTPKYSIFVSKSLHGFAETFGNIRSHADRFSGLQKWNFDEKRDWDWPEGESKVLGFLKWIIE